MTDCQIETLIINHGEILSAHEQQIINLYETTKDIKTLADSIQKIAISVENLANGLNSVDKRLELIEEEKRQKNIEVWKVVVGTALGALVTYIMTLVLT